MTTLTRFLCRVQKHIANPADREQRTCGIDSPGRSTVRRLALLTALASLACLLVAGPAAAAPPAVTIEAPKAVNAGAGHYTFAGHVNPGGLETEWHFTCSPSCTVSPGATLAADEESHLVEADATGLTPNTAYTVTLKASNSGGESSATTSFKTAAADAGMPWWHLESATRPSYIDPNVGKPGTSGSSEVLKLTVTGTPGEHFVLTEKTFAKLEEEGFTGPPPAEEPRFANLEVGVGAAEMQTALEGGELYGPGNVAVSEESSGVYLVEFKGALTGKAVPLVTELSEVFFGFTGAVVTTVTPAVPGAPEVPDGEIAVIAENLGTADLDGSVVPVKLKDVLPAGLEAVGIAASKPQKEGDFHQRESLPCYPATLTCEFKASLVSYDALEIRIAVNVEAGTPLGILAQPNQVTVSGGNAAAAATSAPITLSTEPVPFAVHSYEMSLEAEGGGPVTHAGAHPLQFTTQIALNQGRDLNPLSFEKPEVLPVGLAKDVHFNLPPGLIGNPSQLTKCTTAQFFTTVNSVENRCPASSAVGITDVTVHEPATVGTVTIPNPIFNLEPNFGEPARFGFYVILANSPVFIDTAVRSGNGADYGITAETNNITQTAAFLSATATFWGVPGDPAHHAQRGWGCFYESRNVSTEKRGPCLPSEELHPPVLFSLPTSCETPLNTSVDIDSWDDRTFVNVPGPFTPSGDLKGCNQVPFAPEIKAEPTSDAATSPTGLSFDIDVNDEGLDNPGGFVQSQIKRAVVSLPQGFTTNPSVAEGLKACTQAEFEAATAQGGGCLDESKVGEVEIESPLIGANSEGITPKVSGGIFVAQQGLNPNHNLLTLYMIARSPELGVLVRQALKVSPDPVTGQLTTEVDDIPQLPFSKFHLEFRTGQRAPLVTPPTCGSYTVTADLYPYSEPAVPLHRESSFQITQGPEGQPCPSGNLPPFHPLLEAGTQSNAAGSFSPFYVHMTRKDSEQEITNFSIKLPPGIAGILAGIPYCSDAQIAAAKAREVEGGGTQEEQSPSCPAASQLGRTLVGSGVGNVLAYAPGKIYLAGPYHGSNLSMVSITAAEVGPFDLGTVVVRFALRVDPETAEVFVDSTGSDPIPHIVDGIPVHLRDVRAYVDRPNFIFNPTSCAKTSTASTVLGSGLDFVSAADDNPVTVSSRFQAADCAALAFKPKLALSLKGSTKRGGNPAFKAVLTYPYPGANIRQAQVTLPSSEFLDNAHIGTVCTRVQFKEGTTPGEKCPAGSVYGFAKAVTPVFSEPLEGPVYLRSTGTGAGAHVLPDLLAALHNRQVDIALAGHTEGTKSGGIRNTFEAVPDAPVSKFTLKLKGGNKGLLENHLNLCAKKHRANAVFTGHNGKVFESKPVVSVKCGKGKGKKHKR